MLVALTQCATKDAPGARTDALNDGIVKQYAFFFRDFDQLAHAVSQRVAERVTVVAAELGDIPAVRLHAWRHCVFGSRLHSIHVRERLLRLRIGLCSRQLAVRHDSVHAKERDGLVVAAVCGLHVRSAGQSRSDAVWPAM